MLLHENKYVKSFILWDCMIYFFVDLALWPGDLALWPGDLALWREILISGREIWLSPVI
jgi:hypothetical protein